MISHPVNLTFIKTFGFQIIVNSVVRATWIIQRKVLVLCSVFILVKFSFQYELTFVKQLFCVKLWLRLGSEFLSWSPLSRPIML